MWRHPKARGSAEVRNATIDPEMRRCIYRLGHAFCAAPSRENPSFKTKPNVPDLPSVHPALRVCALRRAARRNEKSAECRIFWERGSRHRPRVKTNPTRASPGLCVQNEAKLPPVPGAGSYEYRARKRGLRFPVTGTGEGTGGRATLPNHA